MKIKHCLCTVAALGITAIGFGCGGYAHMNGQKISEIIKEDLVRFGYCSSSSDCTKQRIVVYDEAINSLDINISAGGNSDEVASIVANVIRKAEPGKVNMHFVNASKTSYISITIDKRAK